MRVSAGMNMSSYKKDILSGLVFLMLGIAVLICVPLTIQDPQLSSVGPRFFPNFIGWSMVVISTALIIQTVLKQRKAGLPLTLFEKKVQDADKAAERRNNELRAAASAVIMLLYAVLFDKIGYFPSTLLCMTALLVLFKVKHIWSYVICYGVAVAIWAGFTFLLSVRLP